MNYTRLLMILALMLQGLAAQAKNLNTFSPNTLPAPAWIQAINITSNSIEVEWAPVPGAAQYKVERFDVTHSVALPDVFVAEPTYLSQAHDPGTIIAFTVSGVESNGQVGAPINAEYATTIIIVDVIANLTIPGPPIVGKPIFPNASIDIETNDADKEVELMDVSRIKVRFMDGNIEHYAEILFWSYCSQYYDNPARIRYYSTSANVTYTENHLGGSPLGPIVSVTFKIGQAAFFTLHRPGFALGLDGNPNKLRVAIQNNKNVQIQFGVSTNTLTENPCFMTEYSSGGNQPTTLISAGEDMEDNGAELSVIKTQQDLSVQPNPFSDNFTLLYALDAESPVQIALLDNMGRQVKNIQLPTQASGDHNIVIQTNDLPTGIYQLALQTSQGRQLTTLVKQP